MSTARSRASAANAQRSTATAISWDIRIGPEIVYVEVGPWARVSREPARREASVLEVFVKPLAGKVAVVAGATRGAGRGIATALGEAGATVYCTGRSVAGHPGMKNRPETIHETAEIVTQRGGKGIAVQVDHTVPGEVASLFERVGEFD